MVQLLNNLIFVTAYQYLDCVLSHWQLANMFQTVSAKICLVQRDERIIYLFFFSLYFLPRPIFFSYATFPTVSSPLLLLYRSSTRCCYASVPVPNISIVFMSQRDVKHTSTYFRCSKKNQKESDRFAISVRYSASLNVCCDLISFTCLLGLDLVPNLAFLYILVVWHLSNFEWQQHQKLMICKLSYKRKYRWSLEILTEFSANRESWSPYNCIFPALFNRLFVRQHRLYALNIAVIAT